MILHFINFKLDKDKKNSILFDHTVAVDCKTIISGASELQPSKKRVIENVRLKTNPYLKLYYFLIIINYLRMVL